MNEMNESMKEDEGSFAAATAAASSDGTTQPPVPCQAFYFFIYFFSAWMDQPTRLLLYSLDKPHWGLYCPTVCLVVVQNFPVERTHTKKQKTWGD